METTHCVFHDPISVKQGYKNFSLPVFHLYRHQPFFTFNTNRSLGRFMSFLITACSLLVFRSCLLPVFNSQ